jgi:hypothetical protein
MKPTREFFAILAADSVRAAVYGLVIILLLIGATALLGTTSQEGVKYQKAIACELAVPSNPITGRDPAVVAECFINEGLVPPRFVKV